MFILLASLPLYGFEYGYRKTGTGFQGVLSHPQSYGIITAIIAAFITGLLLFKEKKVKAYNSRYRSGMGWNIFIRSSNRVTGNYISTGVQYSYWKYDWAAMARNNRALFFFG